MARQSVSIELLKTNAAYRRALARLAYFFDHPPAPGSAEDAEFEILMLMVERYESEHYVLPQPDPVAAIRFEMEQRGLEPAKLHAMLGSRQRAHEVLQKKRRLTLRQIRDLHRQLGISAEVLIQDY